ncbi:MAG: hypothetical protein GF341_01735 [candidate division Zixibacteria bacterium]|nr:hypothetical protein [candidate division Zixibacteria bacterium]
MRTLTVFSVLALLSMIVGPDAWGNDDDRMLVVNGLAETLSLVDRAGDSTVVTVQTLGLSPNEMEIATGALLLTNSVSDDLWVLDSETYQVLRTIDFPEGHNPYDVAVIDDTMCVVSLTLANDIMFVNFISGDTLQRADVGTSPQGFCVQGSQLWVANTGFDYDTFLYGQGTVSVFNALTGAPITTLNVGTNPQVIAEATDGTIHVLCTGNYFDQFGIVYIIDPGSLAVVDSLALGGSPGDVVLAPDGIGYVAAGGWVDSGFVYRYDAVSRTVLNGEANPWKAAQGVIGVSPRLEGGVFAYCFSADSVIGLDWDGHIAETYQLGDGPQPGVHISNRRPGDLDDDGVIDAVDLNLMIALLFFNGPAGPRPNAADLNHDCFFDAVDLNLQIITTFFNATNVYWGCGE